MACWGISATATDPSMFWFCQAWYASSCTNRHLVCAPAGNQSSKGLVVFLPGTSLEPQDYSDLVLEFARYGFLSLGLFYPSAEGQNSCGASRSDHPSDLNCTARERFKVLTGAPNGGATNITRPDSIVNRVAKALAYLGPPFDVHLDPATREVLWSSVIVAGHSNGADHAGFLAKNFNVSRAVMFAGPNDNVGQRGEGGYYSPAPWVFANWTSNVTGQTATPPERMFGFGVCGSEQHPADDECWHWHSNWETMGMTAPWRSAESLAALADVASFTGLRRLCSSGLGIPHGSSPFGYSHMASAADCCMPRFPTNASGGLAGKLLWTNLVQHMLLSDLWSDPPALKATPKAVNASPCACVSDAGGAMVGG